MSAPGTNQASATGLRFLVTYAFHTLGEASLGQDQGCRKTLHPAKLAVGGQSLEPPLLAKACPHIDWLLAVTSRTIDVNVML